MPDLPSTVQSEFNELYFGEELGRGAFRVVYENRMDPTTVFKVEITNAKSFSNAHEWTIWEEVQDHPELSKWFAPCIEISHSGSVLLQARTQPLTRLPNKIPNVLADIKMQNWGRYKGRPVMHDYGNHAFFSRAVKGMRLVNRL